MSFIILFCILRVIIIIIIIIIIVPPHISFSLVKGSPVLDGVSQWDFLVQGGEFSESGAAFKPRTGDGAPFFDFNSMRQCEPTSSSFLCIPLC